MSEKEPESRILEEFSLALSRDNERATTAATLAAICKALDEQASLGGIYWRVKPDAAGLRFELVAG